ALRVDPALLQGAARYRVERLRYRGGRRCRQARHGALLRLRNEWPRSDAGHHAPLPARTLGRGRHDGEAFAAHRRGQGAARARALIALSSRPSPPAGAAPLQLPHCAPRSPPGASEAPPSLVARSSLLSPGGAAPSGSLTPSAALAARPAIAARRCLTVKTIR